MLSWGRGRVVFEDPSSGLGYCWASEIIVKRVIRTRLLKRVNRVAVHLLWVGNERALSA